MKQGRPLSILALDHDHPHLREVRNSSMQTFTSARQIFGSGSFRVCKPLQGHHLHSIHALDKSQPKIEDQDGS